jgi:ABC-type Fe3+-hydroxamate transport system substrate-binding protein
VSYYKRSLLSPEAAELPQVPRVTGRDDATDKIIALKPDLILTAWQLEALLAGVHSLQP